jgi:dTDP-4-amino-4,6-dideoxygalactose transaminase
MMGIGNDLIGGLEQLMAKRVLTSRHLFRMVGESSHCWKAEKEIEQMYPGMHCLLLPSATIGLSLILESLDLKSGQEVLISPFGWLSNWSSILRAGLVPRFLPLDDDLQLHKKAVADRINHLTGGVIVVHLMGRGQQAIAEISEICRKRGVILIEDIAQSFGVTVRGQRAGTFGEAAWCSLNHNKMISTGDAGFILVNDAHVFSLVSGLHDQGCLIHRGKRWRSGKTLRPGLSLRVNELTGAVLRAQLARYHYIRNRIQLLHTSLSKVCENQLNLEVLHSYNGDIPFTVLFKRPKKCSYPVLVDSGWHVAVNVPWLAEVYTESAKGDPAIAKTIEILAGTSAIGSGFIDPYYAIEMGLNITDSHDEVDELIERLKTII